MMKKSKAIALILGAIALSSCASIIPKTSFEAEIVARLVTADEIWMSYEGKTYVVRSWGEFAEKAMELMSQKSK